MSKTLETKNKILQLLSKRSMTLTELSNELQLSKPTIMQHIDELKEMGAIEKVDNEYFRKLKYYRVNQSYASNFVLKGLGIIVILGIIALLVFYGGASQLKNQVYNNSHNQTSTQTPSAAAAIVTPGALSSSAACIVAFYTTNATITSSSGFVAYNINSSLGNFTDYVIGRGSRGVFLVNENITTVPNASPSGFNTTRTHNVYLAYTQTNNNSETGINLTFSPRTFQATNGTAVAKLTVSVSSNAEQGTYWVRIDGPCGSESKPFLLTVGTQPYNGSIEMRPTGIG